MAIDVSARAIGIELGGDILFAFFVDHLSAVDVTAHKEFGLGGGFECWDDFGVDLIVVGGNVDAKFGVVEWSDMTHCDD